MEFKKNRFCLNLPAISLCLFAVIVHAKSENMTFVYNAGLVVKDLRLQAITSKCRLIVIPSLIALTLYCNQKKMFEIIETYPVIFCLLSYFLGNCVIDSVLKYRQIDQTVEFFLFSQTMSRYMLCIFALKNTMKKLDTFKKNSFNEQDFLAKIIEHTGYSMQELEILSTELLRSSIQGIYKLCIDVNAADMEEKFYTVLKEQITLEQMLLLCKNDSAAYCELLKFHENPEQKFDEVMKNLCLLIRKHFNFFMKN